MTRRACVRDRVVRSLWPARRGGPAARSTSRRRRRDTVSLGIQQLEPKIALAADTAATPVTATLVADINRTGFSSYPREITVVGDTAFFSAADAEHGFELWKTDGTASGTGLVKDIAPGDVEFYGYSYGPDSSEPESLTAFKGKLYFSAEHPDSGRELWMSDGTAAGTVLVEDIGEGTHPWGSPISSDPSDLTVVGDTLFFSAESTDYSRLLWQTTGEVGAAEQVLDGNGATISPDRLFAFGDSLLFMARTDDAGYEPWISDAAGTRLLADIAPGYASSSPSEFTSAGAAAYFFASADPYAGDEIWRTDGVTTEQVTTLSADFPDRDTSSLYGLTAAGTDLYFTFDDGIHGAELWKLDTLTRAVALVKDLTPPQGAELSNPGSNLFSLTAVGETLYFVSAGETDSGAYAFGLWRTDADEGAVPVAGIPNLFPNQLTAVGDDLFLLSGGREVWKLNAAGATQVGAIGDEDEPLGSGSYGAMALLGSSLLFPARDGETGDELWAADTATGGTRLVKDIDTRNEGSLEGEGSGSYAAGAVLDGMLYFAADDGEQGTELWKTDGTMSGTVLVKDIAPGDRESFGYSYGPNSSNPANFTLVGNTLFFRAYQPDTGTELWKTDGTAAGTLLVADIFTGGEDSYYGGQFEPNSSFPANLTAVGDTLYFTAEDDAGRGLWRVVGDTVRRVDEMADKFIEAFDSQTSTESSFGDLVAVDSKLFFVWNREVRHYSPYPSYPSFWYEQSSTVWQFDTVTGDLTQLAVSEDLPLEAQSVRLASLDGSLYVLADSYGEGDLWRVTAGAAESLFTGSVSSAGFAAHAAAGLVYFAADSFGSGSGIELWKTDGTVAGTTLVKDLFPGSSTYTDGGESYETPNASYPYGFLEFGDLLVFAASDAADAAPRLWVTDGTATGTVPVAVAGLELRGALGVVGDSYLVVASDGVKGFEPWRLDLVVGATGRVADGYLRGATVFVDVNDNGRQDEGEPATTTDGAGNFAFAGVLPAGPLVSVGGFDVTTGLSFTGTLRAPTGATIINPLTTLVAEAIAGGLDPAVAETRVLQGLGITVPEGQSLATYDPLAVLAENGADPKALAAQKAAASVATILVQAEDKTAATQKLANQVVTAQAPVNLSSPTLLTTVLSYQQGEQSVAPPAAVVQQVAGANTSIQASNSLTAMVQSQVVGQSIGIEVAENGTAVVTVAVPGLSGPLTYELTGGVDKGRFSVSPTGAVAFLAAPNFEAPASAATSNTYAVIVTAANGSGGSFVQGYTVTVTDVNEAPTDIALAGATVAENQPVGTTVGTLSTVDPDAGNTFTYSLVAGEGAADNGSFSIDGGVVKTAQAFNFESKSSYSIRVRSTDQGGLTTEKAFTITVTDVADEPLLVESITPPAAGSYKAGEIVTFTANLSEAATVTGKPQLDFRLGSSARKATYVSGSGTHRLTFQYKVGTKDNADQVFLGSTLALSTKNVISAGAEKLAAALPSGIVGGLLAGLRIDTVAPKVVGKVQVPAAGSYAAGQTLSFVVTFSESVFVGGSGLPSISLSGLTGAVRQAVYASGSGTTQLTFQYVVQSGDAVAGKKGLALGKAISLNAGSITDRDGKNAAAVKLPTASLKGIGIAVAASSSVPSPTGRTAAFAALGRSA